MGPRSGSDGASQDTQPKKVTIVITKKEKKEEPAAAEGGWKALLAELQKKTSGLSTGLKKPVEVKPAPVRSYSTIDYSEPHITSFRPYTM